METVITVNNISKKYKIKTNQGYLTLRETLVKLARLPFDVLIKKKPLTLLKYSEFWALKDITFEVTQGEVIGIIGPNGAGKSTLLKILTGITEPTSGMALIRGRVGSLLEVGTGFHPELSGKENIFLNGAILGMTKKEIQKKIDAIVAFAEVEKYIYTPIKRYSSGMQVRLAFSVAAHLNPEILLIDEVLAVGDAAFQKKCLGKMEEVATKAGRTILFVSHNLEAVERLCNRAILIHKGGIFTQGNTKTVINTYLATTHLKAVSEYGEDKDKKISITRIEIRNNQHMYSARIPVDEEFSITIIYTVREPVKQSLFSVSFYSQNELLLCSFASDHIKKLYDFVPGEYQTSVKIPAFLFNIGHYNFNAFVFTTTDNLDSKQNISFEILGQNDSLLPLPARNRGGKIATILEYLTKKLDT